MDTTSGRKNLLAKVRLSPENSRNRPPPTAADPAFGKGSCEPALLLEGEHHFNGDPNRDGGAVFLAGREFPLRNRLEGLGIEPEFLVERLLDPRVGDVARGPDDDAHHDRALNLLLHRLARVLRLDLVTDSGAAHAG